MNLWGLKSIANRIRRRDLRAVFEAGAGHIGGEMPVIDILTALCCEVLNVDPDAPLNPNRDRPILSRGHTALANYIVLSERGFIPKDENSTYFMPCSRLNGHPDCNKVPGMETNTGPLGHGLPVGARLAETNDLVPLAHIGSSAWRAPRACKVRNATTEMKIRPMSVC